jgi:L-fuconolactonase
VTSVSGGDPVAVIDAHVHLWDLAVRDQPWIPQDSPIRRTFALDDLRTAIATTPVERVVLVQVINDAGETADLLACAADDLVAGVVGWADMSDPDLPDALATLVATERLVGLRHQALAEGDPVAWLTSLPVHRALGELERAGLPFDLIVRPQHLPAAVAVARAHPSLRLVLDHLGKPPIAEGMLDHWATGLRQLAAEPNVSGKLSGLHTMAGEEWTHSALAQFVDVAVEAFGPARLLFGSDWPVSTTAASYAEVHESAHRSCSGLSHAELVAVMGANARDVYGLT